MWERCYVWGVCVKCQGGIDWGMKRLEKDVGYKAAWVIKEKKQPCGGLDIFEKMEGERLVKKIYRVDVEGKGKTEVNQEEGGWMEWKVAWM